MDETFQARLYRQVEKAPERKALAFIDSQGDHSWRSLGEVYGRAAATSQKLGELGVGRGDVCFIVLPSDHRCAALLLGALIRGAVPLLMAPPTIHVQGRYSSLTQVLEYVIRKIKPRVVFLPDVMSGIRKALEGTFQKSRFVFGPDALIQAGPSGISPVIPSATDVAGYQLTSGTTGVSASLRMGATKSSGCAGLHVTCYEPQQGGCLSQLDTFVSRHGTGE
jgi:acyl-CoA synthetase (AMP-forming)/AMP-acid ligase II